MEKREQWGSRLGFILAAIGSAVGLGNIWRFSYMAYENGGGAFLLPYLVALVTAGIPLLILELGFGFFTKSSAPLAFRKVSRKFEWVGWWSVIVGFVITVYYTVIIGWSFGYVFNSLSLGWGSDPNNFFFNDFLGITSGLWDLGGIRVFGLICLIIAWLANYLIISRGVSGGIEKASKIFMPLLFILTIIIVIRGVTLPGAMEGLKVYLTPDFSKITDWKIWVAAYGQIFFTLSLGFGIMIAYASYLPKDSDIVSNGIITAVCNSAYSIITGFGVFGILGYMAFQQGVPVSEVATSGIGLAFIAFPKAINMLPAGAAIFGFLFFLSLVVAGLSSSISLVEAVVSAVMDKFQIPRKTAVKAVCGVSFLLGVPFVTGGGLYILDIVDHWMNQWGLLVIGLVELLVLGYIFGIGKLKESINATSQLRVGSTWTAFVKYVSPLAMGIGIIQNLITEFTNTYGGYPLSQVMILGWGVAALAVIVAFYLSTKEQTAVTN